MDIATLAGIVLGFGLIIGSIMIGGGIGAFIDIPSILIVVGGTIATTLIMERLENVKGAIAVAGHAFRNKAGSGGDVVATIENLLRLSGIARKEGLLGLEKEQISDPFLARGVRMAVDGVPVDDIVSTLQAELITMKARHTRGQKLFKFMAASAPAMGMIGTLIGLVQMLQALDDPSSIGPAMAIALLTTLYGAIIANIICAPIAEKLARRSAEESASMVIVIEGVEGLVRGQNAAIIKDKLTAHLDPKARSVATGPAKAA